MGSRTYYGKIGRKPSCSSSQFMWGSGRTSFTCYCEHKIRSASGFTPLSRLNPGNHRCRVKVRISRMWVAFNPDTRAEYGLDSLLIDDDVTLYNFSPYQTRGDLIATHPGGTMQAHAPPGVMKRLQQQLVEGKVYALSDFTVSGRRKSFMVCKNELMMYMGAHTRVSEVGGDIIGSSVPLHSFEFVDFSDLPSRNRDKSLLTDIMGQIIYIGHIQGAQKLKPIRLVQFRTIEIRDSRGREQDVTLYGDLGCQFDVELILSKGREAPVIAVFSGMCVQYFAAKGFMVRSTSASKCYLDLDIEEVQELRANLRHPHVPIAHDPCNEQSTVDPIQEIIGSWRTIEQLKSLDPLEFQNTRFMCRATLKDVDCTNGYWYLGCFHCRQLISGDGTKFWCNNNGCPNDRSPVPLYKLNAVVKDATGEMNFMIFGEQAQELIRVAAEDLDKYIKDDDDCQAFHAQILGPDVLREYTFQVAVKDRNFVVKWVLNDGDAKQLQHNGTVQMAAGGGLLSQEKSSSAYYNCSPQDEVKMVVKEETELRIPGSANEAEHPPPYKKKMLKVVIKEEPEDCQ